MQALKLKHLIFPISIATAAFSPTSFSCTALHLGTGQVVQVKEGPGPSAFWAHASVDMTGWPTITYGPTYFQLPPLMQAFTRTHECAHLIERSSNEFLANCRALQVMRSRGLSPAEESWIANYHMNFGPLPHQYGGSGAAFWQGTMQVCNSNVQTQPIGSY